MKSTASFTIPKPEIFSFDQILAFLDRGHQDCLYTLTSTSVTRAIRLTTGITILEVSENKQNILVKLWKETIVSNDLLEARRYVTHWLDLATNLNPFYRLLERQTETKHFTQQYYGARLVGIVDLFEAICWAIIGQQINLRFAHKVKRSLVALAGEKTQHFGKTLHLFPSPEALLQQDTLQLKNIQLSKQKIDYLRNVSNVFASGEMGLNVLRNCTNRSTRLQALTSIKGIGPWTANYVLMKSLRDPSCITHGDSGLNKAIHLLYHTDKKPSIDTVQEVFQPFKGWESYFNFYLWLSLSGKTRL